MNWVPSGAIEGCHREAAMPWSEVGEGERGGGLTGLAARGLADRVGLSGGICSNHKERVLGVGRV